MLRRLHPPFSFFILHFSFFILHLQFSAVDHGTRSDRR